MFVSRIPALSFSLSNRHILSLVSLCSISGFSPHIAAGPGRTDDSYRVAHAARRAVNATAVGASPAQLFLQYRPEAAGDKTFFVGD